MPAKPLVKVMLPLLIWNLTDRGFTDCVHILHDMQQECFDVGSRSSGGASLEFSGFFWRERKCEVHDNGFESSFFGRGTAKVYRTKVILVKNEFVASDAFAQVRIAGRITVVIESSAVCVSLKFDAAQYAAFECNSVCVPAQRADSMLAQGNALGNSSTR